MTDTDLIVVAAASPEAAQRLAKRTDPPTDLGPARDPVRAFAGWRRYGFPRVAPSAAVKPLDAVLGKVRKLLALAERGGTEHEAAAAAAAAQRLIDQHNLDVAMLDDGEAAPADEGIVDDPDPIDPGEGRRSVPAWRSILAGGVARANGCRCYLRGATVRVVGPPSRAAAVRMLYVWLVREVERLASVEARGHGRAHANAWRVGCASRLSERLRGAAAATRTEARALAAAAGSVALVRVERALARVDHVASGARVEAWTRENLKLGKVRRSTVSDRDAYARGRAAGDRIGLGPRTALGGGQ